jgi:hypothetical protein
VEAKAEGKGESRHSTGAERKRAKGEKEKENKTHQQHRW